MAYFPLVSDINNKIISKIVLNKNIFRENCFINKIIKKTNLKLKFIGDNHVLVFIIFLDSICVLIYSICIQIYQFYILIDR